MRRIAVLATVGLGLVVCPSGCGRLTEHPIVVEAREEVSRNPRVVELLAGPGGRVECDRKVTGRANETDGIAAVEFGAGGAKGRGTVIVEGRKLGKTWGITRLELRPAAGGSPLSLTADLEARTGTDTPKFDPAAAAPSTNPAPPPPADIEIALPPGGPAG
ncbi:MAG: Cytochrome oxidase complex assembly protein 1 [Planctomycetota bacterium]|jgi:hypothetical protein